MQTRAGPGACPARELRLLERICDALFVAFSSAFSSAPTGDGYALTPLLEGAPSVVYALEASAQFRETVRSRFEAALRKGTLRLLDESDALAMPSLADACVDVVFGMNVVYFLDPLEAYLREIMRVLKPGGRLLFGCKETRCGNRAVFRNTSWSACAEAMRAAGFVDVSVGEPRLQGAAAYTPLAGAKASS